nr:nucleoside 2-deoxyribosyltransferase [uncultured Sphaerochaeta sp.]
MNPYAGYGLYIAGPQCFYERGYSMWHSYRKLAEYYGFTVVLPNDTPLDMTHEDLRDNAREIFSNLQEVIQQTNIIIADLDLFRSSEPDCGTLFELGMVHGAGGLLYGFTRDKRSMAIKNQFAYLHQGSIYAQGGEPHPYADLPYAPSLTASTKIVEGSFDDCLQLVMSDLEERRKQGIKPPAFVTLPSQNEGKTRVFLSGPDRYRQNAEDLYQVMKELCAQSGFVGISPLDGLPELNDVVDPYERAYRMWKHSQELLASCDIFLGDLQDYHGWEPLNDTAFEAGLAWRLGKRCFCYMPDTRIMRDRIPNIEGLDVAGNIIENFNFPVNLMFSASMPILEGDLVTVLAQMSAQLG